MKNIIKHNLKHKVWLTGCVTLLFILCRPMMQLMTYENEKRYTLTREGLIEVMESFFLPDVFTDYIPTVIACVVIAIVFFSYLFSKKMVDLYHSIPVDRKHLFIANYVSGIIVYVIALVAEFVISIFIAIPNHYMTGSAFVNIITAICINFIHFLFGYSITVTAIMLTGNAIVALAGASVIALTFPAIATLFEFFRGHFFVTYTGCNEIKESILTKYYWLSPFTSYATIIQRAKYSWDSYHYENVAKAYAAIIMPCIMAIAFTVLAYYLYLKRPSEAAGKAISFKKTRAYIEIPIVVIGGLLGAWFMCTSINTFKSSWIWVGVLLGVVLSHCVLEVVLNESFKAILSHKIQLVVSLALAFLVIGIFYNDLTNYDKYIPKRESIESASIYFTDIDNDFSHMDVKLDPETGYYTTLYIDPALAAYKADFTDEVLIDKIYGISQIGVSCVDDMIEDKKNNNNEAYYDYKYAGAYETYDAYVSKEESSNSISDEEAYKMATEWMDESGVHEIEHNDIVKTYIRICYKLKNGKIVLREYNVPLSKVYNAINEVYKTEKYKKAHFSLADIYEDGSIGKVEVYDGFSNKAVSLTGAEKDRLLKTYLKELNKLDLNVISNPPIGRISPLIKVSEVYEDTISGYYLYEEFTETLALIESYGVNMSDFTNDINAEELMSVNLSSYNLYGYDEQNMLSVDNLTYDIEENSDYLKELAPKLVNANYAWSNLMLISNKSGYNNNGVDLIANMTAIKGIQRSVSVMLKDGIIPDQIKKDIIVRLWEER